ncbi:hypothetical protein QQF64_016232 [Cirrhinus molitorella]|uniref:Uncharacterized protein n=1 Tax=Cirrhinus molitorella TaxID=172907 RepID=A0ABR3LM97_9TELE
MITTDATVPKGFQVPVPDLSSSLTLERKTSPTLCCYSESKASPSNSLFTSSPPGMAYPLTQSTVRAEHE